MADCLENSDRNQNSDPSSNNPSMNVQVAVRVRPLLGNEKVQGTSNIASFSADPRYISLGQDRSFSFDYVFNPFASQSDLFDSCVSPLVQTFFKGFNATIFAYGQTVN